MELLRSDLLQHNWLQYPASLSCAQPDVILLTTVHCLQII